MNQKNRADDVIVTARFFYHEAYILIRDLILGRTHNDM